MQKRDMYLVLILVQLLVVNLVLSDTLQISIADLPPSQTTVKVEGSGSPGVITYNCWIETTSPLFLDESFNITSFYYYQITNDLISTPKMTLQAALLNQTSWENPFLVKNLSSVSVQAPSAGWTNSNSDFDEVFLASHNLTSNNVTLAAGEFKDFYLGMRVVIEFYYEGSLSSSNVYPYYKNLIICNKDTIDPSFTQTPEYISLDEGAIHTLNWSIRDTTPDYYTLYKNGSVIANETWSELNKNISLQVEEWIGGDWNVTCVLHDEWGNIAQDCVMVTINGIKPYLEGDDITYYESEQNNFLMWLAEDHHPANYTIFCNNRFLYSSQWNGSTISVNVDNLMAGTYSYRCVARDTWGLSTADSATVTVLDGSKPTLNSPNDITIEDSIEGNTILWVGQSPYPDQYWIYVNGTLMQSGTWKSLKPIIYSLEAIDPLLEGTYNVTLIIADTRDNLARDQVLIFVKDQSSPYLNSPSDKTVEFGSSSNYIEWEAEDSYPSEFTLFQNGTPIVTNSWDGAPIQYCLDGLSLGVYNYTLQVMDQGGRSTVDTVIVTVVSADTKAPKQSPFMQSGMALVSLLGVVLYSKQKRK